MNQIEKQLIDLEIIDPESISLLFPRVRDNGNINVLQCAKSGVIFLNSINHISKDYYTSKKGYEYWSSGRDKALKQQEHDDIRRLNDFMDRIKDKIWMEVGGG